jgi:flagellar protein FliO/FliZ
MQRLSGRWLGILIAVVVVGALGVYVATSSSHPTSLGLQPTPAAEGSAQAAAPATQAGSAVPGMSVGTIVGLILKVGIVVVLLGGCLWLLKRYAGNSSRGGGRTHAITILDTITLAQGRAMYVLDVGDRAIVVGATPQQFSTLAEVTAEPVLERLRAGPERPELPLKGLSVQLGGALQRFAAARAAGRAQPDLHAEDDANAVADLAEVMRTTRPAGRGSGRESFADTIAAYAEAAPDGARPKPEPDTHADAAPRPIRRRPALIDELKSTVDESTGLPALPRRPRSPEGPQF